MLAVLLLGTLILPLLRVPDEKHHADMTLMAQEGTWIQIGWPGLGERQLNRSIVAASLSLGRRERALRENRAAQHPPLFYAAAAAASSAITFSVDHSDLAQRLWSFRLLSVFASAALPLTFYLIASEVSSDRWIRLTSAVVPLFIPGITLRDGPMVNNDALLILLTSLSVLYAIRVARSDLTKRTGIGLGLSIGLAALTKAHGLVVAPVAVVAYAIHFIRNRRLTREWVQSATLSGGLALIIGGWWWIRNIVIHGRLQPLRRLEPSGPVELDWTEWLTSATTRLVGSFWGGNFALGGQQFMPLFWILTVVFVAACIFGWTKSRDRTTSSVSSLYALLLVPSVLVTSALLYADRGMVSGVHGRYLFPGIAGVAPLAVIAGGHVARRGRRWLPTLIVAGSLTMTLVSVDYMLDRYWSPFGPRWVDQWSGAMTWSPLPDVMGIGILLIAAVSLVGLLALAVRMGLRSDPKR